MGAQYGINVPLHTWAQYKAAHVEAGLAAFEPGYSEYVFSEIAEIKGSPNLSQGLLIRVG